MGYRLTRAAEDQIKAILLHSARRFGLQAAERYGQLLLAAMAAIGNDPLMPGSMPLERLEAIRVYPTRFSRTRRAQAERVRQPRHLLIYRSADDGDTEVLGIVHDRMVLSRAARKALRDADL